MRFLTPGWLVVAAISAGMIAALHLLNRQRLRSRPFPTVRFVPGASVRAVSRTLQPTDLVLLILRVAIVLLVGLALARPAGLPPRRTTLIALADRSPGTDSSAVERAVANLVSPPDTVIAMDGLSSGIVAARRAAARLSASADSVDLLVVSSMPAGLWDAATEQLRVSWPGRITLVPVRGVPARLPVVMTDAPAADPVRAAIARLGRRGAGDTVQLHWPSGAPLDTAGGVFAAGAAIVGRIPRWNVSAVNARAIAWFTDGTPAVVEKPLATGCERVSAFRLDEGDGLLRAAGLRVIERLIAPCGAGWTPDLYVTADTARITALAGSGPIAATRAFGPDREHPITLLPLVIALVLLGGERILRRRTS